MTLSYKTPAAFRRALTDRLRSQAHPHGPWPLSELQRQFAYDRLLARLYLVDNDWIVKGATALLARELAVRRTVDVDIDIYRNTGRDAAEHDLRAAAARDLGDWFRFETGRSTPISDGANGVRIRARTTFQAVVDTPCPGRIGPGGRCAGAFGLRAGWAGGPGRVWPSGRLPARTDVGLVPLFQASRTR